MKKLIATTLAFVMSLTLTACSSKGSNADAPSTDTPDTYLQQSTTDDTSNYIAVSEQPSAEIDTDAYPNNPYNTPARIDYFNQYIIDPHIPEVTTDVTANPESNIPDFSSIENGNTDVSTLIAAYKAYIELINSLIDTYGIGFNHAVGVSRVTDSYSGVVYAELIDFNNDGLPELLIVFNYEHDNKHDIWAVYGYKGDVKQYCKLFIGGEGVSISDAEIATSGNGNRYLVYTDENNLYGEEYKHYYFTAGYGSWYSALTRSVSISDEYKQSLINDYQWQWIINGYSVSENEYETAPETNLGILDARTIPVFALNSEDTQTKNKRASEFVYSMLGALKDRITQLEMSVELSTMDTTDAGTPNPDDSVFAGWEDFMDNELHCAAYSGSYKDEIVSYSEYDSATELDIDGDGENELILQYKYHALDYGDVEIIDFAYIILKYINGYPVMIADIWNGGGSTSHLRYNGNNLFLVTSHYALVSIRFEVSVYSDGQFVTYFRYTDLGDLEKSDFGGIEVSITEEDGVNRIRIGGYLNEIYLGGGYATWSDDPSASSYEELVALISEIKSYPIV